MPDRPAGPGRQVNGTPRPSPGQVPEPGDVLISVIAKTPGAYALRVIPNSYQIVFDTYDDAHDHARRYAQWCRVDVWTIEPGEGFSPAARFRPPAGD